MRFGAGLRQGHATVGFADYLRGAVALRDVILPTTLPWLRVMLVGSVADEADHAEYASAIAVGDVLPQMLAAEQTGHVGHAKAKNVIFVFLLGGAATPRPSSVHSQRLPT